MGVMIVLHGTGCGWTRCRTGSHEWRISVKAFEASYAGNQETTCSQQVNTAFAQVAGTEKTYPVEGRQAALVERGLDD